MDPADKECHAEHAEKGAYRRLGMKHAGGMPVSAILYDFAARHRDEGMLGIEAVVFYVIKHGVKNAQKAFLA